MILAGIVTPRMAGLWSFYREPGILIWAFSY